MTDNPIAAIAQGVKLVPWLQNATSHEGITTVKMASDEVKIIISALTAAGEMAGERQGCKMAWKQGFCYGDPAIGRT